MTITPTGASSAPATALPAVPGAGSDSRFADLVRQHLRNGAGEAGEDSPEGLLTTEQAAAALEAASAPSAVPSEGVAALLAGLLAVGVAMRTDASEPVADETDASGPAGTADTLSASGQNGLGALLAEGAPAAPGVAGSTSGPVAGLPLGSARGAGGPTGTTPQVSQAQPLAQAQPDQAGRLDAAAAVPAQGPGAAADPAAASSGDGAPTMVPSATPGATSSGSTLGATGPTAAEGPASHPVTDQVFGQVTRLVSRGDGTHRLTLRLHPADLGEVKVVLTVKDGAVDVSLSAGPAAREALKDGSPHLRALLEMTGATTAHVVVRDAAGSVAATAAGTHQAPGQQSSGAGAGDAQDQGTTDAELASRDGFAGGSTDTSSDGRGEADGGPDLAAGLSGQGALAGVRVLPGETTSSVPTGPAPVGVPARLDLNL